MTDSTNPDDYTVVITRTPADGPVTEIAIHETRGGKVFLTFAGEDGAVDDLIRAAREEERHNPYAGHLPTSRAIILAALREAGIDPEEPSYTPPPARDPQERRVMPALEDEPEEEEQDTRDVLDRLAEAQLGLSGIGEVVDDASIQAIADAYDEIAQLRRMEAVLREALRAIGHKARGPVPWSDFATDLQSAARAAIAKATS
jgi:acylphosphatase